MYKAVISDLDGTLLGADHKASKYTIEVVNEIVKKGIKFFIATGRNYNQVKSVLNDLNLKLPVISSNGARINDENGNVIYKNDLEKNEIHKILEIDYKKYGNDIHMNIFSGDDWVITKGTLEEVMERDGFKDNIEITAIEIEKEKLSDIVVSKFFFIGKHENLLNLEEEIIKRTNNNVEIAFVADECMEIFNKTTNKANAAKFLLERENIKIEETVSFGDGENDFQLLTEMGRGFVMANAIERLKRLLPENFEMAEKNYEDGEAKKLVELFL